MARGRTHFIWTALIGCTVFSAHGVEAIAQFVLKNGGNKCVKVDITRDLVVVVDYVAPDLQMVDPEENDSMKRRSMTGSDGDEEVPNVGEDGLDSRYNARNRRVVSNLYNWNINMQGPPGCTKYLPIGIFRSQIHVW